MKINLHEIIDPTEGRVVVSVDAQGHKHARFDLQGLPRVEGLLVDKPAAEALRMTERLCGICPVAHHLAGTRALDGLAGMPQVEPLAESMRRLLHYGSIVEAHSLRFITVDREAGITLKRFSKLMLTGAGSPGHFPDTAIPGGIRVWPKLADLQAVADGLEAARDAAWQVAVSLQSQDTATQIQPEIPFADVALIDESGHPDVFGTRVRIARQGQVFDEFNFAQWPEKIAEAIPGTPAPRPYIVTLGTELGRYRVGPVAQLSVGGLSTPRAAQLQSQWLQAAPDAALARAIITVHVLEKTGEIVSHLMNESENYPVAGQPPATLTWQAGVSTGLVDGPRGILAHTFEIDKTGTISRAVILTPTAQNEPWLAALLTVATESDSTPVEQDAALEQSIREADPCLPISSAPPGQMGLKLDIINEA